MRFAEVRRTTTFRLVAAMGLAFLLAIVALLGLIYALTARELTARTDAVLASAMAHFEPPLGAMDAAHVRAEMTASTGFSYYALVAADGHVVIGSFVPPVVRPPHTAGALVLPDGTPLRYLARPGPGGEVLWVARNATQLENLRARVLWLLASSGVATVLAVALAAVLLSLAPLRRIHLLTTLAGRIAGGELTLRMPVSPRGDELDRIAGVINVMVEEIARLLEQVKGATDAIAHDLRAPLAGVHARLGAMRDAADPALGEALDGAMGSLDLVLARFNALLRIAELEAANRQAGFATVDLMALAAKVCELFEPFAEERGIHLALSGGWGQVVRGDERLLFEALANLVENAIKFNAAGGHVVVAIEIEGAVPVIVVRDDGPGIAADARARVVRRFLRGEGVEHVPGSGLGLSLVAAIVHLHGFAMEMRDAGPGLEVRILCPGSADVN